jgi:DNA-binding MarR family transcriptional regulator
MDKDWNDVFELKERDINVLQIINEENLTCFTFEGLKRRLKIHQETLSRILSRLTEEEILKKINGHYTLTSKAKELLETLNPEFNKHPLTLLQTILPPQISINKIASNLKGKWFGILRWLGYSYTNECIVLKWVTKEGEAIITAIFSQGKLCIEARAISKNDETAAINASYQLMGYITKLISKNEHN